MIKNHDIAPGQQFCFNNIDRNAVHEKLFGDYKADKLEIPHIHWHLNIDEIDFSLQPDKLDPRLIKDGYSIIPAVDIDTLFDRMTQADRGMFQKKKLYESSVDLRTSCILHFWLMGQKLIPPTMIVFNEEHVQTMNDRMIIPSRAIRPIDGKHRLNAAYCMGAVSIPIIVRKKQLSLIKMKLKIK